MSDPAPGVTGRAYAAERDSFLAQYKFRPDPFQDVAIREIAEERSVLVSAPTGAGKTLIAEFAIWLALARQKRIIYTTPLKALSNQKFADFRERFGDERVGLLTGDVKVNSDAPILVMTTEILRNMLFQGPVPGLGYIVLDEFHYLGDESRGTVWEEIVVHAPKSVRFVALSATVGNLNELTGWIDDVHGEIVAVTEDRRPVPLDFRFYTPDGRIWEEADAVALAHRPERRWQRGQRRHDDRTRSGHERRGPRPDVMQVLEALSQKQWLPCIYFIFSRVGCEQTLETALGSDLDLLSDAERVEVAATLKQWELDYPGVSSGSTVYEMVTSGLMRGMGVHHAGILPALKRLTEKLFEKGLCKVVFATETMSLGIHMPARSVFLQELRKRGEAGFRTLTTGELIQMAGRAGRRGIDERGECIVGIPDLWNAPEISRVAHGPVEPVRSRFQLRYNSAVLLLATEPSLDAVRETMERSFAQYQRRQQIAKAEAEMESLSHRKEEADDFQAPCGDIGNLHRAHATEARIQSAQQEVNTARGKLPRSLRKKYAGAYQVKARLDALGQELKAIPCTDCQWNSRPACETAVRQRRRLADQLDGQRSRVRSLQDSAWDQFLRVVEVLQHFGYVEADTYKVLEGGRLLGDLRHENELMVARSIHSGIFIGIDLRELASLLSCMVEEGREGDELIARDFLRKRPHLRKRVETLEEIREQIGQEQRARALALPLHLQTAYMAATHAWVGGTNDWLGLVTEQYGGHEGDLIRSFRRLIDLCRQLADSSFVPAALRPRVAELLPLLDRGIVLDSALL